ncbi:S1 family peptidase [Streptomyces sp. NPDC054844]
MAFLSVIVAQGAPSHAIVGGTQAELFHDRGVVSRMGVLVGRDGSVLCAGVVLDEWTVITTASCAEPAWGAGGLFFNRGDYDLSSLTEAPNQVVPVSSVTPHPRYGDQWGEYDLAVLKVSEPMGPFLEGYSPTLGNRKLEQAGTQVVIFGWGARSFGGSAQSLLRRAEMRVAATEACRAAIGPYATPNSLCLEGGRAIGSCHGDEGGPVLAREDSGQYSLIALIGKHGNRCAEMPYEANVRISAFRSWIIDQLGRQP